MWCLDDSRCITPRYCLRHTETHTKPDVWFIFELTAQRLDKGGFWVCPSVRLRYVFHSAGIFSDPAYQNRVEYLGQPGTRNCSLRISDLRQSDSGAYVFYLVTGHPTQKMPEQSGIQLLVAGGDISFTTYVTTDLTQHHHLHHHHHHNDASTVLFIKALPSQSSVTNSLFVELQNI